MIDIHSHILPNVDDGSKTFEDSIEMARIASEWGYRKIVATPHYISEKYTSRYKENLEIIKLLNKRLINNNIDVEILLGTEVYFDMNIFAFLKKGEIGTINNSKYMLIETSVYNSPLGFDDYLFRLQQAGYKIIIAHPERYLHWTDKIEYIQELFNRNIYFQMNMGSLNGNYGSKVKKNAERLLDNNLIHLVGFDGHSVNQYKKTLENSIYLLKEYVDKETFRILTKTNPENVINDKLIVDVNNKKKKSKIFKYLKDKLRGKHK